MDPGDVDGKMGPKTRAALRDFQKQNGLKATGRPDAETMAKLGVEGKASSRSTPASPSASPQTSSPSMSSPSSSSSTSTPSATPSTSGSESSKSGTKTKRDNAGK